MNVPARFKQSDIRRAIKSAAGLGYDEIRVSVNPDGRIEVVARKAAIDDMGVELK